jgi:hypothetical protein
VEILSEQEAGPTTLLLVRDGQERTVTAELEERAEWRHEEEGDHEDDRWSFHTEAFELPAFDVGPIYIEGFDMEPFEWHFETGDGEWTDRDMTISIPEIRIPDFELPAIELPTIEVPAFELEAPQVQVETRA